MQIAFHYAVVFFNTALALGTITLNQLCMDIILQIHTLITRPWLSSCYSIAKQGKLAGSFKRFSFINTRIGFICFTSVVQ